MLVAEARAGRRWVVAASRGALQLDVRRGMALADARIRVTDAVILDRRPAAEQSALSCLAGWAWRYSSQIHIACADDTVECTRLVLEIGASLRLFRGRRPLMSRIRADLAALGHRCRIGLGDTPQAALAFARAARGQHQQGLENLPLSCLYLDRRTTESLHTSGLRYTGELLALPPAALARRYGRPTLDALERLRGRRPHGLPLYTPPERYHTRFELSGAVETTQGLVFVLRRVFAELQAFLRDADAAIQTLRLSLVHDELPQTRLTLRLSAPAREAEHFERIAGDRLAQLTLAAPVLELVLESGRLRRYERRQNDLWHEPDSGGPTDNNWPAVLDRLRARLGPDAVTWLHYNNDHRPEHASVEQTYPPDATPQAQAPRPLWLLDTPRRATVPLTLIAGPERIETGWWQTGIRRDYFRARDSHGRALWIYRDLATARQESAPVYYLHGLFG